jgi:hypothetical protein
VFVSECEKQRTIVWALTSPCLWTRSASIVLGLTCCGSSSQGSDGRQGVPDFCAARSRRPVSDRPRVLGIRLACELQESDKGRGSGPFKILYPLGEEGVGYDSSVGGVLRRGVDVDGALALGQHGDSVRPRRSGVQEETCETFLSLALFILLVSRVLTNA